MKPIKKKKTQLIDDRKKKGVNFAKLEVTDL